MSSVGRSVDQEKGAAGFTLTEAVFVLAIVTISALLVLMALPRTRESARLAGCQKNLAQIGIALSQYHQIQGRFPIVSRFDSLSDSSPPPSSEGPLRTLLATLQVPDFTELTVIDKPSEHRSASPPVEKSIRGFVCGSDPRAIGGRFTAPINYRGSTGASALDPDGLFAPGRLLTSADIEGADGAAYTSAFSERLVGDGDRESDALANYRITQAPVSAEGCPPTSGATTYRTDAGSSWFRADYRSTLYNHAIPPNSQASCIATDGQTAFMGASSGHVAGVNVLMIDASLRTIRPTIDSKVWRDFGSTGTIRPTP